MNWPSTILKKECPIGYAAQEILYYLSINPKDIPTNTDLLLKAIDITPTDNDDPLHLFHKLLNQLDREFRRIKRSNATKNIWNKMKFNISTIDSNKEEIKKNNESLHELDVSMTAHNSSICEVLFNYFKSNEIIGSYNRTLSLVDCPFILFINIFRYQTNARKKYLKNLIFNKKIDLKNYFIKSPKNTVYELCWGAIHTSTTRSKTSGHWTSVINPEFSFSFFF